MEGESKDEQAARVKGLWRTLDVDHRGLVDTEGLKRGLRKLDHPLQNAESFLDSVMAAVDSNKDGRIEYNEFLSFVQQTEKELLRLFRSIDHDKNGKLDRGELQAAFEKAGVTVPKSKLDRFFQEVDTNKDGVISFEEWRDFLLFIPASQATLHEVMSYFTSTVKLTAEGDVLINDDRIDGLGTIATFLAYAFFGSFITLLHQARRVPFFSHAPQHVPSLNPPTSSTHALKPEPPDSCIPDPKHFMARNPSPRVGPASAAMSAELQLLPQDVASDLTQSEVRAIVWYDKVMPVLIAMVPNPGYFMAGGLAGIVSRTATAPLDRLKVYLIAQTSVAKEAVQAAKTGNPIAAFQGAWRPLANATKDLWAAGGIRSLYAGNGLNVIKVMPESAIKFGSYEASKRLFARLEGHGNPTNIHPWSQFAAGGAAGMISQFFVYPIDTLKFRMQCETVSGGLRGNQLIMATAVKMWTQDGAHSFFRGLPMGLIGMFPYAAIDLTTFEYLKRGLTKRKARLRRQREAKEQGRRYEKPSYEEETHQDPQDDLAGMTTAAIGGFSGAFGASIVYPLNVLRTRLQSQGTVLHPRTYTGVMDVTRQTIKGEGLRGLFKGLTPNLLKVVPAVSITYVVYEKSKRLLGLR